MDLNKLLAYSVDSGASDLHLSVGSIPMVRINGTMQPLNMDPLRNEDMESILPQVMDQDRIGSRQLRIIKSRIIPCHGLGSDASPGPMHFHDDQHIFPARSAR